MRGVAAVLALTCVVSCRTMQQETGFLNRSVEVGGRSYPYAVYVPREHEPGRRWPVVLFLHGAGERGTDGLKGTQIGVAAAIRRDRSRVPAIVVFPQAPENTRWIGEPAGAAMAALDRSIAELNGDPERVYLTGLSMGGYGTWHLAMAHPARFAALVVVCGGVVAQPTAESVRQSPLSAGAADPYAFTANALKHIPVRLFHGLEDKVIPAEESRRMYLALQKAGADVRYVDYPGVGHNAWDRAYEDAQMWTWLLAQRRQQIP